MIRTVLAFAILVVLHYTLRPFLGWRTPPDFLIIALLIAAVRVRPGAAAFIGFLMGLFADSLSIAAFGSSALAMSVVGFSAAWLKAVFFADNLVLNGFFFFAGKWLFDLLFLLVEQRVHGLELLQQLALWSVLSAAVTALAGVLMLVVLRPLLQEAPA
ncbi:MAG: rod shape-determining protein MreD [Gemmatimonadaceae bacterium]